MNAYRVTTSWNHEGSFAEVTEYVLANSIEEARDQFTGIKGESGLDFSLDVTVSTATDFDPVEYLSDLEEHVKESNTYKNSIISNLDDLFVYVTDLKHVDPAIKLNMLEHVIYVRNLLK